MRRLATVILMLAAGCTGAGAPAGGPEAGRMFESEVVPVLQRDCGTSACHAANDTQFETLNKAYFAFPVDAEGKLRGASRIAAARKRAEEKLSGAGARFAEFIRKPLDESLGGLAHRGGSQYRSMRDAGLDVLMAWAEMAKPAVDAELPALARRYAEVIQPVMLKKGCMRGNCHGAGSSNFLAFDPGVVGEFDSHAVLQNYKKVVLFLNLEGPDALLSRLIRKNIPQAQGGIFHRGGNNFFNPGANPPDPDLKVLVDFVHEAREVLGEADTGTATGVVFVATDATPRAITDIAAWQPGGDVYLLSPPTPAGSLTNLTAAHHSGPADIRDAAVSYDGQRVAFAMRKDATDCLNLYVMNLDGSGLIQVTKDTGTLPSGVKVSSVEPVWGPDDRLYFVSTRAGQLSALGVPVSNIWRADPVAGGGHLLQATFSRDAELAPAFRFFNVPGKARPEQRTLDLTFTAFRNVGAKRQAPLMRVPPDFRADYHPHYGTQNPQVQMYTQLSQLPDHREIIVMMDERNVWEGGALGIIDRNLGPVIKDGLTTAVLSYVESSQRVMEAGREVAHQGVSPSGYFRDPVAMPDGTVVVSHAPARLDLSDRLARPDTALYRVTLQELAPNTVRIGRKELLVDVPGKVETDPAPVLKRRREEIGDPKEHLENGKDWGEVLNFDLAVALRVAAEDSPSGDKDFDTAAAGIRGVRYVEELPLAPADYPGWPDTSRNRIGRGKHGMRRIIAELPATSDRSVYVGLPAVVPFYYQGIDDTGMSTFTFDQWFFVLPGEILKQVTRREVWNNRCSACHGSKSGIPGDTVSTPDVLTQASRVAANYDPTTRTDLPPVKVGIEPADRLEVDFERDVQPILGAKCATSGCPVAGGRAPDLGKRAGAAGFSGAYEALTAPGTASGNGFAYVDAMSASARTSYLSEVLTGREQGAPRGFDSEGCGAPGRLSLAELKTLMRWMDLGASYLGIGTKDKPALPVY